MALGAMSAALERGVVIGEDISITGFDDIPLAAHSHPPLTTVKQPIYEIGKRICHMLIQILKGENLTERQVILEPRLVTRKSSGRSPLSLLQKEPCLVEHLIPYRSVGHVPTEKGGDRSNSVLGNEVSTV
jgi:ABC-type sugar transport system substrate-binding protein